MATNKEIDIFQKSLLFDLLVIKKNPENILGELQKLEAKVTAMMEKEDVAYVKEQIEKLYQINN